MINNVFHEMICLTLLVYDYGKKIKIGDTKTFRLTTR
jgi:hypothetical protein